MMIDDTLQGTLAGDGSDKVEQIFVDNLHQIAVCQLSLIHGECLAAQHLQTSSLATTLEAIALQQ